MLTFLFPGQGSQQLGMGKELFSQFPEETTLANQILGYSIEELCLQDPNKQLNQTQFTQPALFTVCALSYLKKVAEGVKPDYVAGHSLGEYAALFAANVFDFATGLKLVKKRGELMSQAQGGAMAAVIGLSRAEIEEVIHPMGSVGLANHNSYQQSVISGLEDGITEAKELFAKNNKVNFIPLKVSGAFHSVFMSSAQAEFQKYLTEFTFKTPTLPVVANVNASIYHPATVVHNLSDQITHSVLWVDSIEFLRQQGNMTFEEVGPGMVLQGLIAKIASGK